MLNRTLNLVLNPKCSLQLSLLHWSESAHSFSVLIKFRIFHKTRVIKINYENLIAQKFKEFSRVFLDIPGYFLHPKYQESLTAGLIDGRHAQFHGPVNHLVFSIAVYVI